MRHPHFPRPHGGFTLIELLAVILIVGVLTTLAFVVAGRGRAAANDSRCLGNLRQLQMANLAYAANNRGKYVPVFVNSAQEPVSSTKWHNNRSFASLLAVGAEQAAGVPSALLCPLRGSYSGSNGYGYNFTGLNGGVGVAGFVRGVRQTDIQRPAETLAFADSLDWQIHQSQSDSYTGQEVATTQATAYRHNEAACVAYWDGHVARLPRAKIENQSRLWRMLE